MRYRRFHLLVCAVQKGEKFERLFLRSSGLLGGMVARANRFLARRRCAIILGQIIHTCVTNQYNLVQVVAVVVVVEMSII